MATLNECCVTGFAWDGKPTGRVETLGKKPAYVTGTNPDIGLLMIHDIFGWEFNNARLLADHVAREVGATVYLPDFFEGGAPAAEKLLAGAFAHSDIVEFLSVNGREQREPEIFECARAIRADKGHSRVGAFGYCYGGWASFRLAAKEHAGAPLVDCISMGHPSLVTEKDIDECAVPVQILAPERDHVYTPELKAYTVKKLMENNIAFHYQHFPDVEHACFIRGDANKKNEREAQQAGKDAVVYWFKQHLGKPKAA
ncbi:uncharacterized protein PpBr36_11518 [Pyricularia pennisetigena]|uniref:uncharacterized protein n=1 Tax=Pyricularia pennisetigena TaxID=1578925 RepID=UPI001151190E|nr:uncharacterized protein PpBr36_11518 [Pyricularia pennisetigena]TLS20215.1 hypothetical protein PpBr36_11518 [Pyricularia pennisetigena]